MPFLKKQIDMAFLKFNKAELVNLDYSTKREILLSNKAGAYCNSTIVTCNTRRYHGLFAVTLDRFDGDRYMLLSSLDESLVASGKRFNLGIHRYNTIYEPRGHKYVVDFVADPYPQITYKVGEIVFRKSIVLSPDENQLLVRYELLESPSSVELRIVPLLAFRNVHSLTHSNPEADFSFREIPSGASFNMYRNFPDLNIQLSGSKPKYAHNPYWNYGITYSEEYRRGFDCIEDLFSPGTFSTMLKKGESVVLSASVKVEKPNVIKRKFTGIASSLPEIKDAAGQLVRCADSLITNHNSRRKIHAGYSWLYTGLLRETLLSLPGLALYGIEDKKQFEEILDNLIADEQERLLKRTTQVEAPLMLAPTLQAYIEYGVSAEVVWKKYGATLKSVLESYLPGVRREVAMQPNGLLWAQLDGVALSWMNTYVNGRAVTERAGYQVETNSLWYNAICFALEMENKFGSDELFVERWKSVRNLVKENFMRVFWYERGSYLADYVDNNGQNTQVRPNQLYAIWLAYSAVPEELFTNILRVIDHELVTARGIRSLSPRDPDYKAVYEGSQIERDLAYYSGCTHPFLLGPYIDVSFRIKGFSFWKRAEWLLEGFYADLSKHGVGAFSELYDGDPPHEPHGAISSAISTAGLVYARYILEKYREVSK